MTTPTIFSDVAGTATNNTIAKFTPYGVLPQKAIATIPAATAAGTNIGMIRFQRGFSLLSFELASADLDTLTNVVLDVGYLYDGTTGEDPDAFLNNSTIAQGGTSTLWPVAGGLLTGVSFTATGPGYLNVQTGGGATTTAGDITLIAQFTYDLSTTD